MTQEKKLKEAWIPTPEYSAKTHIAAAIKELGLSDYNSFHRWSVEHYKDFWTFAIEKLGIVFKKKFSSIVDLSDGVENPRWLVGAKLNVIDSCFQASADKIALVFPDKNHLKTLSYGELNNLSNRVANSIIALGLQVGDPLAIAMPMHVEAVAIYLGIIKAGCCVVAIADSFAAHEMEARLEITGAKGIFTQVEILRNKKQLPLYEKVKSSNAPRAIVIGDTATLRNNDILWSDFLIDKTEFTSIAANPMDTTTILFSSGTTAQPKAIPWNHTTAIKAAVDAYFHHDVHANDVFAWPTNLGWMMGPWLIYASLINQATIALYEDVATTREFGQFIEKAQVTLLGVVPSLVKAWCSTQCMEGLNWNAIKAFSSTGECSNPEEMLYLMNLAGNKPVIEYCGGTEIGGAYLTSTLVQSNIPSTFSTPTLGTDFVLLDEKGGESTKGEVALIPPAMGLSTVLLNADHHHVYYESMPLSSDRKILRRHGDQLEKLNNGYYRALGRADDTMNLGGIKVSAVEIERVLSANHSVVETAAIAFNPPQGGPSLLIIFAQVKNKELSESELRQQLQTLLNEQLNPLFKIHQVVFVEALPRTASNKIMRRVLRDEYLKGKT